MKQDVLEILIYLFENYSIDGSSFEPGQTALAEELLGAGFSGDEVGKAFAWLENLLEACEPSQSRLLWQPKTSGSLRFYAPEELEYLTPEGGALLARLLLAGLLDQRSHETVIDQLMALGAEEITFNHIKWVVLMVLSNQPDFADISDWAEGLVTEDLAPVIH